MDQLRTPAAADSCLASSYALRGGTGQKVEGKDNRSGKRDAEGWRWGERPPSSLSKSGR